MRWTAVILSRVSAAGVLFYDFLKPAACAFDEIESNAATRSVITRGIFIAPFDRHRRGSTRKNCQAMPGNLDLANQ